MATRRREPRAVSRDGAEKRGIGETKRRRRGAEPSLAVVTDRRGEGDDSAAARGLLHTLRAGRLDAPTLAPAVPGWAQLRFAVAPAVSRGRRRSLPRLDSSASMRYTDFAYVWASPAVTSWRVLGRAAQKQILTRQLVDMLRPRGGPR
jgi:hypothetical protein